MSEDMAAVEDEQSDPLEPDQSRPDVYEVDSAGIDTELLTRDVVEVLWELKAMNVQALDLRGLVSYTDFVVIATGNSDRHVRALASHLDDEMDEAGWEATSIEGVETGRWAVLDYGDVVVHVFETRQRDLYDLESKWVDAERLDFPDAPEELYGHFQAERFE
ncbi:MAG: ribosome silencing factor [Bradymonadaceae bacterium]